MNHDGQSALSKSTVILVVVSAVAIALHLIFAHSIHFEFLGLLGFGIFCFGYGIVLPSISRPRNALPTTAPPHFLGKNSSVIARKDQDWEVEQPFRPGYTPKRARHALTIDLEDYFHTEVASQGVSLADWESQPSRIEASTHRLLDVLDRNQTLATFFVLGWVAKRYPDLIREIHHRGHEIACHSLNHQLVSRLTPETFYETTATAKDIIESVIKEPLFGYRAPCFSITRQCEWAFDSLAKLGFTYDSSVHPVHHPVYGNPMAPRSAYAVAHGRMMEFPIATWKIAGHNLSVGGGAYLRLLPYQYIHHGLKAWEKEMPAPAMVYLHPWEIDPYQPYIPLTFQSRIRQTWGTTMMEEKLQRLLTQFRFAPVREVHKDALADRGILHKRSTFQRVEEVEQVAG